MSNPVDMAMYFNGKDRILRTKLNRYGVRVTSFRCKTCGAVFTICPAPENEAWWQNCLSPSCESYDESRDMSGLFA